MNYLLANADSAKKILNTFSYLPTYFEDTGNFPGYKDRNREPFNSQNCLQRAQTVSSFMCFILYFQSTSYVHPDAETHIVVIR